MDPKLIAGIKARMPRMNPILANGIAVEQMMSIDEETGMNQTRKEIDKIMAINASSWPDDFKYVGNTLVTAWKHFDEITREYGSKRIANIAKTNTYMVNLNFTYKNEPLFPRPLLLPYVEDGGIVTLNGANYTVSPVSKDVGFSVLNGSIFIPFRRTKLTFKQKSHHYFCNGNRKIMYVIWSQIHNEMGKRTKKDYDKRDRIESSLAQYFFAQFGVTQTFKQWAGADVQVGYLKDFPPEKYPRDQWNVYQSAQLTGNHPTGEHVLVVPAHQETDLVKRLVAGFWYVVDTFPNRFVEPHYADTIDLWRIILGHMVFGDFEHQGKVAENIKSHMYSLETTLDEMTSKELESVGVKAGSIWELFHSILTDMAHHLYASDIDETSMYNKRLTVLPYVMEDFNYAVSMFSYMFQGRRDKTEWSMQELNDGLKRSFKLNTAIRKLTSEHGELDTLSMPGSNKVIRCTSILVPQDRAKSALAHNKSLLADNSRLLNASIAEVCQYRNQPKNNPDGRGRLNLFAKFRHDGLIERREEVRERIDHAQSRFSR
ncbi:hypothetical protein [Pseudomonas phage D6]|nr:hypothetical protein [Pseudomonas phage D6]